MNKPTDEKHIPTTVSNAFETKKLKKNKFITDVHIKQNYMHNNLNYHL